MPDTLPLPVRLARGLNRAVAGLASVMNYVAGWGFIACAAFITFDVLARRFLGFSSAATTEISGYMLAFGIAWGLAHALTTRTHIRVDVLVNRLPLAVRQYLHAFALALLTGAAVFMAWAAWLLVDETILFNAHDTSGLAIPLIVPQGLWFVGLVVFAATAVLLLVEVLLLLATGRGADEVDRLLGPRSYREETQEALEAVGLDTTTREARP